MSAPWPFTQEEWDKRKAAEGESTSAKLRRVEQEHDELRRRFDDINAVHAEALSIVARIGDALSPTGERPEEALGTLVADVEALVEQRDELSAAVDRMAGDHIRLLKRNTLAEAERNRLREDMRIKALMVANLNHRLTVAGQELGRRCAERDEALRELSNVHAENDRLRASFAQAHDATRQHAGDGLINRANAQLVLCGPCDAGVPGPCACPPGDPRSVIQDLLAELGRLQPIVDAARAYVTYPDSGDPEASRRYRALSALFYPDEQGEDHARPEA